MRFMMNFARNRIRAILTPAGLAFALSWGGGIKNSAVQLVQVSRSSIESICDLLQPAARKMKTILTRCNDISFEESAGNPITTASEVAEAGDRQRIFTFSAYAYSGIDGTDFNITLGNKAKKLSPVLVVTRGECKETASDEDSVQDNDSNSDGDSVQDNDSNRDGDSHEDETQRVGKSSDFAYGTSPIADQRTAVLVNASEDESLNSSDETDLEDSSQDSSDDVECVVQYTYAKSTHDGKDMLTNVRVLKYSGLDREEIQASNRVQASQRVPRESSTTGQGLRVDMVAVAVRHAAELIQNETVYIRDGRKPAQEYELAKDTVLKPRKQGWARRPRYGETRGATYLHSFRKEVVELFNAGVVNKSLKMGPAQMRQEIQLKHPGRFSIPSRSELRTSISALFAKSKASKGGVIDPNSLKSGPTRRGRKSALLPEVAEFIVDTVKQNRFLKPREVLLMVRQKFQTQSVQNVPDKMIKSKVSATKTKLNNVRQEL